MNLDQQPHVISERVAAVPDGAVARETVILTSKDLCSLLQISRACLVNMVDKGEFPPPLHLSERRRGWRLGTYLDWLEQPERCSA